MTEITKFSIRQLIKDYGFTFIVKGCGLFWTIKTLTMSAFIITSHGVVQIDTSSSVSAISEALAYDEQ